ncbi:MAG: HAMP domain-containing histidine kinase [Clostridia bacterium]|nr:HAMP domain-containing histidine kinase [Clostridia bacterium]
MKNRKKPKFLIALYRYFLFFVTVAFLVTSCTMLFVSTLSKSLNVELTGENLQSAAKLTFLNVLLLSLLFTIADMLRRKFTMQRAVKRIVEGTEKLVHGDFSVRIKPLSPMFADDGINACIESFNRLAEELSAVETLRCDFIANVSHEMKTPLAVMQNYASLMANSDLTEEQRKEYAQGIVSGAKRMSSMMSNILKLSRLENQQTPLVVKRFNVSAQLCACLLQYENVWERKGIEIVTDIPDDVQMEGDEELLSHVWNNLFSNAFKFTKDGGRVEITLQSTQDAVCVKVADTGIGMSPEVGARIFEKFYQGDESRATQGNGLGLALVKRVVDIMQGEITVQSKENVGTTFCVTFRRA